MTHKWTPEQCRFLEANIKGRSRKEMTRMINETFNLSLTDGQVIGAIKNRGLSNGRDTRFKPGMVNQRNPKGLRMSQATEFKKGNRPWNYKPVGSERVNTDGYVDVKIADPNKWRQKHHLIWEEAHGPIPKGHMLIFGDGNRLNVTLDNLILITLAQNARLNGYKLRQDNAELTRTAVLLAELKGEVGKRGRQGRTKSKGGR